MKGKDLAAAVTFFFLAGMFFGFLVGLYFGMGII